jgi:hypothetical protein
MAAERFRANKVDKSEWRPGLAPWEGRLPNGHRIRLNFRDQTDAITMDAELEVQGLNQSAMSYLKRTRLSHGHRFGREPDSLRRIIRGHFLIICRRLFQEAGPRFAAGLLER